MKYNNKIIVFGVCAIFLALLLITCFNTQENKLPDGLYDYEDVPLLGSKTITIKIGNRYHILLQREDGKSEIIYSGLIDKSDKNIYRITDKYNKNGLFLLRIGNDLYVSDIDARKMGIKIRNQTARAKAGNIYYKLWYYQGDDVKIDHCSQVE